MDSPVEKELYNILNNKFLFNLKEPSLGPEAQIKIYRFLLQLYDETWTWASSAAVPDLRLEDKAHPSASNSITKPFKSDLVIISGHLKRMDLGHFVTKLEDILADGKFVRILYALIAKLEVRFNKKELSDRVGRLRKREFLLASKSLGKKICFLKKFSSTHTFSTNAASIALPTEEANVIPLGKQLKRTPLKPSKNDHPQPGMFASPEVRIPYVTDTISFTVTALIDHDEHLLPPESSNSTFTIEPTSLHTEDKEDIVNLAKKLKQKPNAADKAMPIEKMQPDEDYGRNDRPIRPLKSHNSTFNIEPTSPLHTKENKDVVNLAKKPNAADKAMPIDKVQPEDDGCSDRPIRPLKSHNSTFNIEPTSPLHTEENKDVVNLAKKPNAADKAMPIDKVQLEDDGCNDRPIRPLKSPNSAFNIEPTSLHNEENKDVVNLAKKPKRKPHHTKKTMRIDNMQLDIASHSPAQAVTKKGKANQRAAMVIGNMQHEEASKSSVETEDQEVAESPSVLTKKGKVNRKAAKKNILELESNGTTVGDSVSTAENEEPNQSEKLLVSPKQRKTTAKALQNDNIQAVEANRSLVQTEEQEVAANRILTKKPIPARKNTKAVNRNIFELDSNGKTMGDSGSTAEKDEATQIKKWLVSREKRKRTAKAMQNDHMQVEEASKSSVETEDQEIAGSPVLKKKGKANRKAANENILELDSNDTTMGEIVSTAEKEKATQSEKLLVSPVKRKRTAKALQNDNVQAEDVNKFLVQTEEQKVAVNPILTKKSKAACKNSKPVNKEVLELDNKGTNMGDNVSTTEKEETAQVKDLLVSPTKPKRKRKVTKQAVSETIIDLNDNDDRELPLTTQACNVVADLPVKAKIKKTKSASKATEKGNFNQDTTSQSVHVQEEKKPTGVKNDPPAAKDESSTVSQLAEKTGVSKKQAKVKKFNDSEKENPVSDLKAKPKKTKGSSKAVDEDAVSPILERRVLRQRKHVSYLEN